MEIIKILPIILIVMLLSGCVMTYTPIEEIVTVPPYGEDAIIEYFTFNIPLEYNVEEITDISLTLHRPDDIDSGTFTKTFPGTQRKCKVPISRTQLFYPGTWTIEWNIDGRLFGTKHFWVEDKTHDRDHYVVRDYTKIDGKVDFKVYNDGKEDGWVEIVVFATNRLTLGGKHIYGKTYLEEEDYLRPGHKKSYDIIVSETDYVTIMLNGDEYEFP